MKVSVMMYRSGLHHLLSLALIVACSRLAAGLKFSVKSAVPSPLAASLDPPSEQCQIPGICYPVNQTVGANTLYYWCGFLATHRSVYRVISLTPNLNLTTALVRQNVLNGCFLANLTNANNCKIIPDSACDKVPDCDTRVFGLVFPDDICLIVANNNKASAVMSIRMNNFYDSPRYYGTCFTIFYTVVFSIAMLGSTASLIYFNIVLTPKHGGHGGGSPAGSPAKARRRRRAASNGDSNGAPTAGANGTVVADGAAALTTRQSSGFEGTPLEPAVIEAAYSTMGAGGSSVRPPPGTFGSMMARLTSGLPRLSPSKGAGGSPSKAGQGKGSGPFKSSADHQA